MSTLDAGKDAVAKAAEIVTDSPVVAKAKGVTTTTAKSVVDSTVVNKAKEITSSTAKNVNESDLIAKVREFSETASAATTDTAKNVIDKVSEALTTIFDMVSDLPIGGKNIGERAQRTVDTVHEKLDVDQIQDQVAKLRHQIDGVVESWQESFRPSTAQKVKTRVKDVAEKAETQVKSTA